MTLKRRLVGSRPPAEDIAWLGLVAAAAITVVAFAWLAQPLSGAFPAPRNQFFAEWRFIQRPEPLEDTRFLIAAAIPILLAAVTLAVGSGRPGSARLDIPVIGIQLAVLVAVAVAVANQVRTVPQIPVEYFQPLLLSVPVLAGGIAIGLALTVVALSWDRVRARSEPLRRAISGVRGRSVLCIALVVLFTALWLLPGVFTDANVAESGFIPGGHIPVQAEDYFAVVNGRTPLADYIPIYSSLLPLALSPVLSALDSSITAFSVLMCALSVAALTAVYGAFLEVTRRRWAALALYLPFVALSLFPWTDNGSHREFIGNYYALMPNRYLGPLVVAWLLARHFRRGSPRIGLLFFVGGLTVLNNFEFGAPCLAALAVAVAVGIEREGQLWPRIRRQAAEAAVGLAAAVALVSVVILVRAGALPDPKLLVYWTRIFAREGYGLLPMPELGLHWALYATYTGAILTAAVRCVNRAPDRTLTAMLAFSGVFGMALGQYFAGRSVAFQLLSLFPAWGLAMGLLAWTTATGLHAAGQDGRRLRRLLLPAFASLAGLGVMVAAIAKVPSPVSQIERISDSGAHVFDLTAEQRFVQRNSHPGEKVLLIATPLDHRVAERAGVVNTSPVNGVFSLLSPSEVLRSIDSLESEGGERAFIRPAYVYVTLPEVGDLLRMRGYRRTRLDPLTGIQQWDRR